MSHRILSIAERVVGARFAVENTGGGWRCHVARLEGGPVLVLSDGLGDVAYDEREYFAAALYPSEAAWRDSGDEHIGYADTIAVQRDEEIGRVVTNAIDTIRAR